MGQGAAKLARTGEGRGGRTLGGLPADVTLTPDVKAFAGAIGGGGFGARRPTAGGRTSARASASGPSDFSGLSGLTFNIGG